MNAEVILFKNNVKKVIRIEGKKLVTVTTYGTLYDGEIVYRNTKTYFNKRGWFMKTPAVVSESESMERRRKEVRFLGHRVGNDGTVGE